MPFTLLGLCICPAYRQVELLRDHGYDDNSDPSDPNDSESDPNAIRLLVHHYDVVY